MQEIGVRIGAEATVIQHAGFGGLVLNIAGSRVAIDHRSAKNIEAELVA
ncbi:FeoA family protein [Trueperella bernardiae]